jgi:hypothetical protein
LEILGYDTEKTANPANRQYEIGNIDPERTVHAATATNVTFRKGDTRHSSERLGIDPALSLYEFPERVFDLGDRRKGGISIPGEVGMAAFLAQAAVNTRVEINLQTGGGLLVEDMVDDLFYLFRS